LSARAKWASCAAAFAVGGLVASIPAFLGKSAPVTERSARYEWIQDLPETPEGISPIGSGAVAIASTADGQQLLASRSGNGQLCFLLGRSGGGCQSTDSRKHIQLVGLVRGGKLSTWWGIVGDDVRKVRVYYRVGDSALEVRRGFGVSAEDATMFAALDAEGNRLGSVHSDNPPIVCDRSRCSMTFTFVG